MLDSKKLYISKSKGPNDDPLVPHLNPQIQCKLLNKIALPFSLGALEAFENLAKERPNELASIGDGFEITYGELSLKSGQFASYLRNRGVIPGKVLALSTKNNLNLLVGILGIMKAGGVYLPLDPQYPIDRLRFMIEDSEASLLITEQSLFSRFKRLISETIAIDELDLSQEPNIEYDFKPTDPAYLIYTSGSTGTPKGVLAEHQSLASISNSLHSHYRDKIKALLFSSISFDINIRTIFHTLTSGGTLVLTSTVGSGVDPNEVFYAINRYSINFLLCVPSFYGILLDKEKAFSSLRHVVLGGEAIPQFLIESHSKYAPNAILHNEYGLTECGICSTVGKLYDPILKKSYPITIGKALTNISIYIIDETLKEVPFGSEGEICISGQGLTRCYLNYEALNKKKFLELENAVRVYRTGDRGRYLPSGNIEFLGRIDKQVKIRGYRIELEEIENNIRKYPEIKDCVVIVQERSNNPSRLIAYFSASKKVTSRKLQMFLRTFLPQYMIPSAFHQMEQFPLTKNGKIDRSSLPIISEKSGFDFHFDLSSMKIEDILQNVWQRTLQVEKIGKQDNFFSIGGDSLLIVQLQTAICNIFNLEIPIVDLFQHPTLSQLSGYLNQILNKSSISTQSIKRNKAFDRRKAAYKRIKKQHAFRASNE